MPSNLAIAARQPHPCRRRAGPATQGGCCSHCAHARRLRVPAGSSCRSRRGPPRSAQARPHISDRCVDGHCPRRPRRVRLDQPITRQLRRDFVYTCAPGVHPRPQPAPVQRHDTVHHHGAGQQWPLSTTHKSKLGVCHRITKGRRSFSTVPNDPFRFTVM